MLSVVHIYYPINLSFRQENNVCFQIEICRFEERINLTQFHRVYWLAEQGLAQKRAFLAGIALLIFTVTEIIKQMRKGIMPMKKNALDVQTVTMNVLNNLSGNLAGGALLANIFYGYGDL